MVIPVNVFTGFLGSGKTTIILNLIKSFPKDYKVVVLKNEFGDKEIDSKLYKSKNIQVTEMLNGCLCCILVGKLKNAIYDILKVYSPDRIIIETSGTAYPAPIVWELDKIKDQIKLDSIINVVDAINFRGYKDLSYSSKIQAQYCDLILINKSENIEEPFLDKILDDVYELNPNTPKIKTLKGKINPELIFSIGNKNFALKDKFKVKKINKTHHHSDLQILEISSNKDIIEEKVLSLLKDLPKWDFYRIKGIHNGNFINYVFGRYDIEKVNEGTKGLTLSFFGKNLKYHKSKIQNDLSLEDKEITIL